ncbi:MULTISPECIES: hypothetical protein [unclassified Pseudomonas]|jgi:hypothetical protein|uniref:hypothetical protein n=1 Tax=unclassified Pseudomonas TaxID=196821 RepID=UPI0002709531|nr:MULTISPECIES: hypothetical protein [unclassified Pseudomonas]EJM86516.1 hypothetical protein PMI33_03405 [Pseudomonas sp. GM67]MBD9547751.1 hypothetical protein [Pseudomonas sp. PDM01]
MSEIIYPRRKVFLAFFLCPLMLGFIAGIIRTVTVLTELVSNPKLLGSVRGAELLLMPFLTPLLIQLAFFLPFLGYALVIVLIKVKKTLRNCMVVSFFGSCVAASWVFLFISNVVQNIKGAQYSDYVVELLVLFAASMATCWLTAHFFLPEGSRVEG